MAAGIGLTVFALFVAEYFLTSLIIGGVAIVLSGILVFLVFKTLAARIAARKLASEDETRNPFVRALVERLTEGIAETDISKKDLEHKTNDALKGLSAAYAGAVAIGISVAALGAVIALVSAVASLRQVERIDVQNQLIEAQIYESQVNRISSIFSAQIPSLMTEIERERNGESSWVPSRGLQARIQTIIDTSEPYLSDPEIEKILIALREEMDLLPEFEDGLSSAAQIPTSPIFSPERGQLLRILIASGLDFSRLEVPFDFSGADLRAVDFTSGQSQVSALNLGATILKDSNLIDADLTNIAATSIDVSGSFLPQVAIVAPLDSGRGDASGLDHLLLRTQTRWPMAGNAIVVSRTELGRQYFDSLFAAQQETGARLGWRPYIFWGEVVRANFASGTLHLLSNDFLADESFWAAQQILLTATGPECATGREIDYLTSLYSHTLSDQSLGVWHEVWREVNNVLTPQISECIVANASANPNPPKDPEISFAVRMFPF
ncbi:hypothetical protein CFI11_06045 [Thalassococcus sp. S3]|nr:hypothetical protein CFI11_06045 [Thalassococcus sp. S3]